MTRPKNKHKEDEKGGDLKINDVKIIVNWWNMLWLKIFQALLFHLMTKYIYIDGVDVNVHDDIDFIVPLDTKQYQAILTHYHQAPSSTKL